MKQARAFDHPTSTRPFFSHQNRLIFRSGAAYEGSSWAPRQREAVQRSRRCLKIQASQTLSGNKVNDGGKTAIVIVDHGSRREESNAQLEYFVDMFRKAHPDREVLAAHMELARPSIKDAIYECWKRGCSKVAVAPYFLSQGRHIQQDIPSLVAEANEAHPELECIIAEPIDLHRLLRRVSHTLAIIASFAGLDAAVVGIIKGRVEAALDLHKGKQSQ